MKTTTTDAAGHTISIGDRVRLFMDPGYYPIKEVIEISSKYGEDIVVFNHDPYDWSFSKATSVAEPVSESEGQEPSTMKIDTKSMIERVLEGELPEDVIDELLGLSMRNRGGIKTGQPKIRPELLKKLSTFKKTQPKLTKAPWEK